MTQSNILIQCLLGMQCDGFAMIAADQMSTMSIIVMTSDEKKLHDITKSQMLGIIGDSGETMQFTQFISKNLELYQVKNGYSLSTGAVVHFIRKNLADTMRTDNPSIMNMLVGGYDEKNGGQLYTLDFLASSLRVPFGVHGFGGMICMGIMDRYHKPTLTEEEAYEIMKACVHEIHRRLFINLPNFQVKVVNKHGIHTLPTITPGSLIAYVSYITHNIT